MLTFSVKIAARFVPLLTLDLESQPKSYQNLNVFSGMCTAAQAQIRNLEYINKGTYSNFIKQSIIIYNISNHLFRTRNYFDWWQFRFQCWTSQSWWKLSVSTSHSAHPYMGSHSEWSDRLWGYPRGNQAEVLHIRHRDWSLADLTIPPRGPSLPLKLAN